MARVIDPELHNEEFSEHLNVDTDARRDPQGLVNTIDEDTQSIPHTYEYHAGAMNDEQALVSARLREEQEYQTQLDRTVDHVSICTARQVRFRTYTINFGMGCIKILDDKTFRGDSVINVQSGGPLYISDQQTIAGAQNTAQVVTSRVVRTNNDLYAVVASGVTCTFDVQEEFE